MIDGSVRRRSRRQVLWQETTEPAWAQAIVISLLLWCLWWCCQGPSAIELASMVHPSMSPLRDIAKRLAKNFAI